MHSAGFCGMVLAMPDDEPFDLSPREAAAILGFHEDTIKRWAADGKVRAFRTPGGWWRFRRSDLTAFAAPTEPAPAGDAA